MRAWLGGMAMVMGICAWAQPLRLASIAHDAAHDAYYVADELVVGLEPNAPTALVAEAMRWVSLSHESVAPLEAHVLRLERGMDAEGVRELLLALPGVRYVERNYLVFPCNAPMLAQQWGLTRIQASQAWAINGVAVAASDPNDRLTDFSQYGAWVDIAAPGSGILSTLPGNFYERWSGTSMACPHGAGAAALLWACAPSLTNQQLRVALEENADPVQPYWFEGIGEGKGRLNLLRALQAALQMENTPTVSQLNLNPTSITAGGTVRGTVVLSRAAGAGGAVVQLRSSNPNLAWCAAQITIPQGQTTGTFTIRTVANGVGSATITASAGGVSRTATLQVVSPFRVQSVSIAPATVAGGRNATLTVRLTTPAPAGGIQASLSSSAPQVSLPASVVVPAGQASASVSVRTSPVAQRVQATLTATLNGSEAGAVLTVNPPAPLSLMLTPSAVPGGRSTTATVFR